MPPIAGLNQTEPNTTSPINVGSLASHCQVTSLSNPALSLFETETEHLYFDFFLHHTSNKLSGSVGSVIWTSIVPQACVQDSSTRHIVVAIAALDKIAESAVLGFEARTMADCFGFKQSGAVNHYNIAVKHYHRAIVAMANELTARTNHNIRKILIFCLLTICFESYIGNQEAGNIQALTGNNLLSSWLQRAKFTHPSLATWGVSSPSPDILEDDLIHAFIRLRQRAGAACTTMNEEDEAVKHMPQEFSTLKDAKIFWELLERRIERSRISQDEARPAINGDSCFIFRSLIKRGSSDSSIIEEHASAVARWTNAFEGVLARSRTPIGNADYLGATTIKMRSLIARPLCLTLNCETEMAYDAFYQEYIEILAIAKSALRHSYPVHYVRKIRFRFDAGMVPALFYLVILCRHQTLRREALKTLEAYPCREGPWDSSMAVSIGRWIAEVEEAGCEDNPLWIPAAARVRIYKFSYSLLQCRGILFYQMWQDGKYEANNPKQVELTW
jgi:hypothetical protein